MKLHRQSSICQNNEAPFFIRPESLTLYIELYSQFMDATKTDRWCSIQHDECSMPWMSSTYAWTRNWAIAFMCICKLFFLNFYFECEWCLSPSKKMLVFVAKLICISSAFVKFHFLDDWYPKIVSQLKEVLIIINKQVAWFTFVVLLCGLASLYN